MSIQAVAWVLDQDADDLPGKAKLVLVSIANHADHTNGYCWLNLDTIARESSMPVRSLFRYIGALVRNGFLRKELRKGKDGKQRATDYWVLFDRPPAKWDWGAKADGAEDEEPQDVVDPSATVADGETDLADGDDGKTTPVLADGPSANGGTRYIAEPSKTKPSKEEESPGLHAPGPPRGYKPPPVEPMGAIVDPKAKQIFVIEGTRAWKAWVAHKQRTTGISFGLTTTAYIDGRHKRGWYFPTLFPPDTTGPPIQSLSDQEDSDFVDL